MLNYHPPRYLHPGMFPITHNHLAESKNIETPNNLGIASVPCVNIYDSLVASFAMLKAGARKTKPRVSFLYTLAFQ